MGTHLNAYKKEATDALSKVREALSEAEAKLDALVAKLESTQAPAEPVSATVSTDTTTPTRAANGTFAPKS